MAFRLELGQYYDTRSPLHRLDARVKIPCALVLMVAMFFIGNAWQLLLGAAASVAVVALSRVPLRRVLGSIRPLFVVLAIILAFNVLFVRDGNALVEVGPVAITTGGAWRGLLYAGRLTCALLVGTTILLTTTPARLTDAFDALLSPLARLGLPAHEIAMVCSLTLRFVPVVADEAGAILDAQAMRGGALDEGGMGHRVRSVVPVVVALLASGLRHADNLSRALDARCYEGGTARTHLYESHVGGLEAVAVALSCAFVVALALLA